MVLLAHVESRRAEVNVERHALRVTCSVQHTRIRCELELGTPAETLNATSTFVSPLAPEDREQLRWLVEERPRLRSATARAIAGRIEQRLGQLGAQLGAAVFGDSRDGAAIAEAVRANLDSLDVVVVEQPSTPHLPWELMTAPGSDIPLARAARSFVRTASASSPSEPPVAADARNGRLRILLVVSRPAGVDDAPFRSVASRIVAAAAARPESRITIDVLRPPTLAALTERLQHAASAGRPFQIVHFDGHGVHRASPFAPERKRGYLCFEQEGGGIDRVDGTTVGNVLIANGVRALLLNACRSGFAGNTDGEAEPTVFESLAADVQSSGVDSVLAMGFDVYVTTAAALIGDVYAAQAAGRTLGESVSLARRRLHAREDGFAWIVPVAYENRPLRHLPYRDVVAEVTIGLNAATPATEYFVDPEGADGPRSAGRPFVGYDDILLTLERELYRSGIVEIVGLAGSGKSAVAAEFARWVAWTQGGDEPHVDATATPSENALTSLVPRRLGGRVAVLVVEMDRCRNIADVVTAAGARIAALAGVPFDPASAATDRRFELLRDVSASSAIVWLFENADTLLATGETELSQEDVEELTTLIRGLATGASSVILTARGSSGIPGVVTLALPGLDDAALNDLLLVSGARLAEESPALNAWLGWTQGLPSLALAVTELVDGGAEPLAAARKQIRAVQLGDAPADELAKSARVEKLKPGEASDERAILALYLYQGFISRVGWGQFAGILGLKTNQLLGGASYAWPEFTGELRRARHRGLVCPLNDDWLMVHPLSAFAATPHFYEVARRMAGPDPGERHRRWVLSLPIVSFCMVMQMPDLPVRNDLLASVAARADRQNRLFAANLVVENQWFDLLRVLKLAREELRATLRIEEWRQLLGEAVEAFAASSQPAEPSLDDPALILARLLEDESELLGADESARLFREIADRRTAFTVGTTVVMPESGTEMDIGAIKMIAALLRQASTLRRQDQAVALDPLRRASEIATTAGDELRLGEVHYETALVYANVTALVDLKQYEEYAKRAAAIGERFGPLGLDLLTRAKASVGNAIVRQLNGLEERPDEREREAEAALTFAKRKSTSVETRASATNGLGVLHAIEENFEAAADEFLLAAQDFASTESWDSAATAYYNAGRTFARSARPADGAAAAKDGLAALARSSRPNPSLRRNLESVLSATSGDADAGTPSVPT